MYAFLVFCVSGLCSLALDVDHILVLLYKGLPITIENLCTRSGRPLHWPSVLVLGFVCIIVSALLAGLPTYYFLKKE